MRLGHLHLATHSFCFAGIFAVDVGFTLSVENLVVFALSASRRKEFDTSFNHFWARNGNSPIKSN